MANDPIRVNKWAAGSSYGPILSQTDLYLLKPVLELHPILTKQPQAGFILIFNLLTGYTGGFNDNQTDRDYPFQATGEPATIPRVQELCIITERSPWCTIVRNEQGVNLGDICNTMHREYTENIISEPEMLATSARMMERIKQVAARNAQAAVSGASGQQWGGFYGGAAIPQPNRLKRVDWLCEAHYFDNMTKEDRYIEQRLGFTAPNIFVMKLETYAN
ncbi:hypothetical protein BV25DRAFT_1825933 [Artomyces pyxidatus]|uniref:Uncharacterized protein n=1 Tax=Artomyces pyxidatus TaxID=48021 RepID=A0ACB8T1Q3_9AGAM|nr:hypothetical protein BV25DRAFT_1825933 [Artomyces pyxidatus]